MHRMPFRRAHAVLLLLAAASCSTLSYDLEPVPFPVSAKPAADAAGEPFAIEAKQILWVHGLLGEQQPDVAALLHEHCGDAAEVTDFRVGGHASIWDWLGTHLSLGFVRLKTVTISGRRR